MSLKKLGPPKRITKPVATSTREAIFSYLKTHTYPSKEFGLACLCAVQFTFALRISNVVGQYAISVCDIEELDNSVKLYLRKSKTGKKIIPLMSIFKPTFELIKSFISYANSDPVLKNKRLYEALGFTQVSAKKALAALIKPYSSHGWRIASAVFAIKSGVDSNFLQVLGGWSNSDTALLYGLAQEE